jgi:uncharacterized membrane protein YgcG
MLRKLHLHPPDSCLPRALEGRRWRLVYYSPVVRSRRVTEDPWSRSREEGREAAARPSPDEPATVQCRAEGGRCRRLGSASPARAQRNPQSHSRRGEEEDPHRLHVQRQRRAPKLIRPLPPPAQEDGQDLLPRSGGGGGDGGGGASAGDGGGGGGAASCGSTKGRRR